MNRRITAWLAIAALALNALWPLLAQAGPAEFALSWCSAAGAKAGPVLPAPESPKLRAAQCPFCAGAGDAGLALSGCPLEARVVDGADVAATGTQSSLVFFATYLAASPRGPPALPR